LESLSQDPKFFGGFIWTIYNNTFKFALLSQFQYLLLTKKGVKNFLEIYVGLFGNSMNMIIHFSS